MPTHPKEDEDASLDDDEEMEEETEEAVDSDQDMDEDEDFDESLIPEVEGGDLTLENVDDFVRAYDLAGKWGKRKNWAFYSGKDGGAKIRAFQAANSDMEGGEPVSFHDVFLKSFQNHVREDVDKENLWKVDAMLSYHFGLLATGTIHILLPKDADILKTYKDKKFAYWYLYELPAVLRKGGGVKRIVRYDAENPDEDEGELVWERGEDHEGPREPPSFEKNPN
jgi:hypothetical protein